MVSGVGPRNGAASEISRSARSHATQVKPCHRRVFLPPRARGFHEVLGALSRMRPIRQKSKLSTKAKPQDIDWVLFTSPPRRHRSGAAKVRLCRDYALPVPNGRPVHRIARVGSAALWGSHRSGDFGIGDRLPWLESIARNQTRKTLGGPGPR